MTDGDTPTRAAEPYVAPKPEGPEEISARAMRLRESALERSKRKLLEKSGLGKLSPAKRLLVIVVVIVEVVMISSNLLTDIQIPGGMLIAIAALSLLAPILERKPENKRSDPNLPDS